MTFVQVTSGSVQ